jgi:anti-sigma B factor antagonist
MEVKHMNAGDVKILNVSGRIDANTAHELQDVVLKTAHHDRKLLLDLSNVNYMSSAGLRVMLLLHREIHENEGRVILVGLQDRIRDAMEMTGFLKYFAVVPDVQTGIEMMS